VIIIGIARILDADLFTVELSCWGIFGFILIGIGSFIMIVGILVSLVATSNQIRDIEELRRLDAVEKIYEQKATDLTKEFASYLARQYPDLEKEIITNMTRVDILVYMVKYPELQSQKSIADLVDKINKMKSDIYDQRIAKEKVLKDLRYRLVGPWYFNSWIREIPKESLSH